jgi:uncharacterized iron-regulated protein
MKKIIPLLFTFFVATAFISDDNKVVTEKNYMLYSNQKSSEISLDNLVSLAGQYDVILFGEEHNDSVAHFLQFALYKKMHEKYGDSVILSMEMFDRDVQNVLDEYMKGMIKESHFKKDARAWSNYRDYRPLVEYAKTNKLDVYAANAPMRYVSLTNRKGQAELLKLSPLAKTWIAPLPFDTAQGAYYTKLREVMGYNMKATGKHGGDSVLVVPSGMPGSLSGQSLWDATMAYTISTVFNSRQNAKVLHLNGRFHSDDFFGIYQQLQKYAPDKKVLVISALSDEKFRKADMSQYKNQADIILLTDPDVPKTFKDQ